MIDSYVKFSERTGGVVHSCAECVVRDRDGKLLLLGNVAENIRKCLHTSWMSQEVSKCFVNGLFHLLVNGIYWGEMIEPNHLPALPTGHPSKGTCNLRLDGKQKIQRFDMGLFTSLVHRDRGDRRVPGCHSDTS